jgi:hypothetical protein
LLKTTGKVQYEKLFLWLFVFTNLILYFNVLRMD